MNFFPSLPSLFAAIALLALCSASIGAQTPAPRIETVLIPGETFMMGNPLQKKEREYHDDEPRVEVTVHDFKIGKTKVTAAQMCEFLNSVHDETGGTSSSLYYSGKIGRYDYTNVIYSAELEKYVPAPGRDHEPANQVTWKGAVEFCRWISAKTGKKFRLPSEAEWELAALRNANDLNMCTGIVGEWAVNRWKSNPTAADFTNSESYLDDLISERVIRGQRKWRSSPAVFIIFTENSMHEPKPWTRQHHRPFDIKNAAWFGFRVLEEIPSGTPVPAN